MGGDSKGKGKGGARKPRGGRGGTHPWINSQIIQASENKDVHHLMNVIIQHLPGCPAESAMKKGVVDSVEKCAAELPELQADSFAEICRAKAQEAFHQLGANVVVQDSGFVIEALNGFPGPYTKYVLATIGVSGLLKLMEGQSNRRCGFMACVGFADASGQVHVFEEPRPYYGTLTTAPREAAASLREGQKLFDVFVPDDLQCAGQTLGEMTEAQLTEYRRRRRSAFRVFAEHRSLATGSATAELEPGDVVEQRLHCVKCCRSHRSAAAVGEQRGVVFGDAENRASTTFAGDLIGLCLQHGTV
eukprot:g26156.t1